MPRILIVEDDDHIRSALNGGGDVELVSPPCAGNFAGVGDLLSVEKNVGTIVDAAEVQPHGFPRVPSGQREFFAVPPRSRVGTVGRHRNIRKVEANGIADSRVLSQIHAVKRIGQQLALYLRCHHGRRNIGLDPVAGVE